MRESEPHPRPGAHRAFLLPCLRRYVPPPRIVNNHLFVLLTIYRGGDRVLASIADVCWPRHGTAVTGSAADILPESNGRNPANSTNRVVPGKPES